MSVTRALTELEIGLISRAISATNPYHLQPGQRIAFEGIRAVFNHRLATGTPRLAYLVCIRHDGRRKGPVTFRIDEMSRVEELSAHRANRTKFDLHEFARQSFGAFFGEEPLSVVWRFSPSKADEAEKFIFHPSQTQIREPDGSLLVSFTAKGSVEMCWELFQWGRDVEIVEPERLKGQYVRLSAEIAESANRYESAQS